MFPPPDEDKGARTGEEAGGGGGGVGGSGGGGVGARCGAFLSGGGALIDLLGKLAVFLEIGGVNGDCLGAGLDPPDPNKGVLLSFVTVFFRLVPA